MILSMTGYGKAESQLSNRCLSVEIRGLNSKQLDLNTRIALELRDYEHEIRQIVTQRLERGKIDVKVELLTNNNTLSSTTPRIEINREAFQRHYEELAALCTEMQIPTDNILSSILHIKDVQQETGMTELTEQELSLVTDTVNRAIDEFIAFRKQEGAALQNMFSEKLDAITSLLEEIEPYEKGRIEHIRQHLESNLQKLSEQTQQAVDRNRLEQEMIYYLEKLDITEEKVRLTNHIRYFREVMEQTGSGVGKKLGFVAQEMGREINTLGSKSNQSEMQILVVK
ncbi:MAG: YicC family protein, partial [Paludibacteraceae bacterium]|nr:YicC family protein [Paludibacteraceae bacterium]